MDREEAKAGHIVKAGGAHASTGVSPDSRLAAAGRYLPIYADNRASRNLMGPVAYDCARVVVIRDYGPVDGRRM